MKKVMTGILGIFVGAFLIVLLLSKADIGQEPRESTGGGKDYDHIIVTYNYIDGCRMDGLDRVTEKINEITREEIGVEIELKRVNSVDAFDDYPLWLSQKETIDLMVLNFQDITAYIDKDMMMPLDALLETDGRDILSMMAEGQKLSSGAVFDGQIYGLANPVEYYGSGGGLWIPKRYLEELSFPYSSSHIYSMKELEVLFGKLKERYPDSYPLGQVTSGNTFSTYTYYHGNYLGVGSTSGGGYIADADTHRLADFYESEEYKEFLATMRQWYEAGYIYPDNAFTDAWQLELFRAGIILSIPLTSSPGMFSESNLGEPVACLKTSRITYGPGASRGVFWTIPTTSSEPAAAMRFLNLMYTDARIVNLFQWGIEGEDYVVVDRKKGIISFPEGETEDTVTYLNMLGLYGNQKLAYTLATDASAEEKQEYSDMAEAVGWEYEGFNFDSSSVNVELSRVQEVLNRYLPALESGSVDLDQAYPEFIQELKNAGIDKIIETQQEQLDAWLSENEQ